MRFFIFSVVVTVLNYLRITIEEEEERLLLSRVVSLFLSNMSQQGEKSQNKRTNLFTLWKTEDGELEGVQAGRHRETAILATGYLPS